MFLESWLFIAVYLLLCIWKNHLKESGFIRGEITIKKAILLLRSANYEIVVFAILMLQAIMIIDWDNPVSDVCLPFYAIDYRAGFASRMLIGSIVELLTDKITLNWITGFTAISLTITFFLTALLIGKLLRTAKVDIRSFTVFCVFIFLLTQYSIVSYAHILGMLDVYWCLCALLILLLIDHKCFMWLIPVICFIGLATQYLFVIVFFPTIFVMLIYKLRNKTSVGNLLIVCITLLTCIGFSVYFIFYANDTMVMNKDELYEYMSGKVNFVLQREYFDFTLYNYGEGKYYGGLKNYLYVYFFTSTSYRSMVSSYVNNVYGIPFIVFFVYIWGSVIKVARSRAEKLYFIICAALPLGSVPLFILSTDTERFLFQVILTQFLLLFYVIIKNDEAVIAALKTIQDHWKAKYPLVILFVLFALSATFIHSIF